MAKPKNPIPKSKKNKKQTVCALGARVDEHSVVRNGLAALVRNARMHAANPSARIARR